MSRKRKSGKYSKRRKTIAVEITNSLRISPALVSKMKSTGLTKQQRLTQMQRDILKEKIPVLLLSDLRRNVQQLSTWMPVIEEQGLTRDLQELLQTIHF